VTDLAMKSHHSVIKAMSRVLHDAGLQIIVSYASSDWEEMESNGTTPEGTPVLGPDASTPTRRRSRVFSKEDGEAGVKAIAMPGLASPKRPSSGTSHVWYAHDAKGSPHFEEAQREKTKAALRDVMHSFNLKVNEGHKGHHNHHTEDGSVYLRLIHEEQVPAQEDLPDILHLTPSLFHEMGNEQATSRKAAAASTSELQIEITKG